MTNVSSQTKPMARAFWGMLLTTPCLVGNSPAQDFSSVQAAQTQFAMLACENCTAPPMKAVALRSTSLANYVSIYNLPGSSVRKYRVHLDSTRKYDPPPEGAEAGEQRTASNPAPLCGAYSDAIESAVDSSVQNIYDTLHQLSINAPKRLSGGTTNWWVGGNGIRRVSNDASTGQPFNLPDVAWEAPQGTAYRLLDQVGDILKDQAHVRDVDPDLAELIYGVWMPSLSKIPLQPSITSQEQLQLDSKRPVKLKVCDVNGNCAVILATRGRTQLNLALETVVDKNGNSYPSPQLNKPSNPSWSFPGGSGYKFIDSMTRHGVDISIRGGYSRLSCAWVSGRLTGCVAE